MRTFKILLTALVAVATLGFAACSNDSDVPNVKEGEKAFLSITIANNTTRAAGTVVSDSDNGINNFVAFAFLADGAIDGNMLTVNEADISKKHTMQVSNKTTKVAVVANVDPALFGTVKTLDGLNAIKQDLSKLAYRESGKEASVWASALVEGVTFVETDGVYNAEVEANLAFAVARINFTVDATQYLNQDTDAEGAYKITGVAVLNAKKESAFFGTYLTEGVTDFYSGIDSYSVKPTGLEKATFLMDAITGVVGTENFHFYVTENNAAEISKFPTILTLILDNGTEKKYQSIQFTPGDAGKLDAKASKITRGMSYDIKFTVKGDAKPSEEPGGGDEPGGTEDPTIPSTSYLDITVKTAEWTPVKLEKEF